MSTESSAPMATTTEPAPAVEEKKIEASELASQTEKLTVSETSAPAPVPAVEEKKEEEEKVEAPAAPATTAPETSETVVVPPPASTQPEKKAVAFDGSAEEKTPAPSTPLEKLFAELSSIVQEAAKMLPRPRLELTEALKWRKNVDPVKLLEDVEFDAGKFGGLGFVTVYPKTESHGKEIVTWNIYGSVKDKQATFGNVEEFVKWRAALMELSVKELDLPSATEPIPADGVDPYRMVQVHDYNNVSFLRMDPAVKAASKEVIQVFSMAYPELLKEKFFVNVPVVMGWVFAAMKLFLSPETVKKFHPLAYGSSLAGELKAFGPELPVVYGGKGKDIKEGLTVKYGATPVVEETPAAAEPAEPAEKK
ncbi:related to Phosphatidylinositol transfer protein sfh5 [Phialocephala subalpina]|uniref:Phosphatidylinositol transfer protein SFH5 n=1 Tax=Phialocephala subalpina TaxID=576137 RepID=A0A1L7WV81_9HELO|nr:related to Phosphatidylinositol transfer protein sfh5 [Phialocephala subalpina]